MMSWPRDWAATTGMIATAAAMAAGFAIDAITSHHAAPILDTTSIGRDRVATDECTDGPANLVCPPLAPTDVKWAMAPWHGTAFCAGGPFDPLVITPPPPAACPPVVAGCPGWVPNVSQPPVATSGPPSTKHEGPPPPVVEYPEPGPPAPVASAPVEAPPAPVEPAPAPAPPSK
jgi:hypothetical protein